MGLWSVAGTGNLERRLIGIIFQYLILRFVVKGDRERHDHRYLHWKRPKQYNKEYPPSHH